MTECRAIKVTAEHIRDGVRGCSLCPVGLALREAFQTNGIAVGVTHITVRGTLHRLPVQAQLFIKAFDVRAVVHPFTFELEMP